MLEFYAWNPRNNDKKEIHGSLKGIAKAVAQGGNVGHMSLAVTLYENTHDLNAVDKQFEKLKFQKAMPIYETVKTGEQNGIGFYKRGRKLNGLSAFLSLWPGDEGVNRFRAIQSLFRIGGKIKPIFSEKLQMDMREEWSDPTPEKSSTHARVIEHHRGSEFQLSELSQKKEVLEKKIGELDKQRKEIRLELEKKGRFPKTALEKKLEARIEKKRLEQRTTADVFNLLAQKGLKNIDGALVAMQHKEKLEKELKILKLEFHNALLNADIPKIYAYIEGYRQLTSEFNKINTFYENAPDSNKIRSYLLLYLQQFPQNEDAKQLLLLQEQISDKMNKLHNIEKEELRVNELISQYESVKKELDDLNKERNDIELEIENREVTEGLNPDYTVSLPTFESGQPYFLDEIAILKKMQQIMHDPKFKYDLFDKNCARGVKDCVMAGLSTKTRDAIKNLPDFSKHFFETRFIETPVSVIDWIFKLKHYLNELNNEPKLQSVTTNHKI
ncbi:hypothetical protein DGG96_19495 [Legionella qingyii]|uniref:Uncharacterized protein n=1 Tax=Legionella qingyii TaxID=2184757 RepID=A0A317TX28_9GAMM|nr:hypothetical protein [Legionella qingyii]PWY53964.1 hypothetical protein DGG96_19495 [Legionella qingyii]RUR18928.1 hypothetical protein ELY20_16260 [Legionella qingyii]RUR21890.1 hypothetical protein ELY16_15670 [Legionella qingyii]